MKGISISMPRQTFWRLVFHPWDYLIYRKAKKAKEPVFLASNCEFYCVDKFNPKRNFSMTLSAEQLKKLNAVYESRARKFLGPGRSHFEA